MLKGWAVSLVAIVFALPKGDPCKWIYLTALIPIALFWSLDTYYLKQERQYRNLYNLTRTKPDAEVDFDLDASKAECCDKRTRFAVCLVSGTEAAFYIPLAILTIIVIAFIV